MLPLDFFFSLLISPFVLGVIGYLGGRVWGGAKGVYYLIIFFRKKF